MTPFATLLLSLAALGADADAKDVKEEIKKAQPAKVTVTAEVACLHCSFGVGDSCCAALKIDDKTPIRLTGKQAEELEKERFGKKTYVVNGTLSVGKDKVLTLAVDSARLFGDADKDLAPAKGEVRITGTSACGHCDLKIAESCQVALKNGDFPVLLTGKDAEKCESDGKTYTATGKVSLSKTGIVQLEIKKLETAKEKKEEKK
jgi:hypothetical protein